MLFKWYVYLVSVSLVAGINGEVRVAIAHLESENITGSIVFTEIENGLRVTGAIIGLPEGLYGFHIHQLGDIGTCDLTGAHFNPDNTDHGGRDHTIRHVGDLGNVRFVGNEVGIAVVNFTDSMIALRGRNNILGRALVLHENEDDLGLGDHELSLTTGNAGPRVACGVIGILSPADPWDSSATVIVPSLTIFVAAISLMIKYLDSNIVIK